MKETETVTSDNGQPGSETNIACADLRFSDGTQAAIIPFGVFPSMMSSHSISRLRRYSGRRRAVERQRAFSPLDSGDNRSPSA